MRNPDLAGLRSRTAFSYSECSSAPVQTQFCPSPRSRFFLTAWKCSPNGKKRKEWKKRKGNEWRGGMYLELLKK